MKIKLITAPSTYEAAINVIKQIDVTKKEEYNLLVVPDAFSMQAENLLFDVLNLKSVFNIEIVGISKLASHILKGGDVAFERVSALEETFTIFKAVKQCEDKFEYFGKSDVDFCSKLLQIIKQFKGCKIKPEMIKDVGDGVLDRKMHDIKLVYQKYDELLGDKLDLSKMLDFCSQKAEGMLDLSKLNLYFANFDSFSLEVNDFVCKLAKEVGSVCIGMSKPLSQNNAFIFEDDILKKTTSLAKENAILVETLSFPTFLDEKRQKIEKNLFGFKVEEEEQDDYFLNVLSKNKCEEIEYVAKYIKNAVFSGASFKDFAVAVPDESYYEKIKASFEKYGILFYSDQAVKLSETPLARFLLKMLEFAKLGLNKERFCYLASCPFIAVENRDEVLKKLSYFCVEDTEEFLMRFPQFEKLISQINLLAKAKTISQMLSIIKSLVTFCEEEYQGFVSKISEKALFKEESQTSQSLSLFLQVLDKLDALGAEQQISLLDFESLFMLSLDSVKVETIPTYIDAVYVGDATKSYFEDVQTLFVVGATANALPKNKSDTGLIDDDDIEKLRLNFLLEPQIKVLNRRSRLKLFECLLHAKVRLVVTMPVLEEGRVSSPSSFVVDLRKLFGENVLLVGDMEMINVAGLSEEEKINNLKHFVGSMKNLPSAYTLLKNKHRLPLQFEGAILSLLDKEIFVDNKTGNLSNSTKQLLIKNNRVSASQLETYFVCPFKHFISYGLKIKQKETIEPDRRLFGIFEHALVYKFVSCHKDLSALSLKDVEIFIDKNVFEVAKDVYDEKILNQKHFLSYLKNESKIVLSNIFYEQKYSKFKPILLEEKVESDFVCGKKLVGFVDRVDVFDKYFRVIDYKTGKTQSIKKDLYYGKKLQLFLYADALKKKLEADCAGVYYFDCQTKYTKGDSKNRLNGLTLASDDVVFATDKRLGQDCFKSDLVGFSIKKTAKEGDFSFKGGNPVESIEELIEYAKSVSEESVREIEEGFILDKPLGGACSSCPYLSVCCHRDADGYRFMQTVLDENLKG